ncbi:conserved hypothetical protein [Hyphomicrobiales bacterium]|jgi:hypothetical protein|nr:conserved hypothetical protein [Hyphomicrobiales bacterium]CAH1702899.1 hypothetical protein BOSEA1005_30771 [Hyphomicrobiales bacterium]CAI0347086.1 conserved hypothetical protein [Hyphomicrobiales bacterium]
MATIVESYERLAEETQRPCYSVTFWRTVDGRWGASAGLGRTEFGDTIELAIQAAVTNAIARQIERREQDLRGPASEVPPRGQIMKLVDAAPAPPKRLDPSQVIKDYLAAFAEANPHSMPPLVQPSKAGWYVIRSYGVVGDGTPHRLKTLVAMTARLRARVASVSGENDIPR